MNEPDDFSAKTAAVTPLFEYRPISVPDGAADLTGLVTNMLTVLWPTRGPDHILKWMCQCECGNQKAMHGAPLKVGETQSCGCLRIKDPEGKRKTRLHSIWRNMNSRCRTHENYAGRGIVVCAEWADYDVFAVWAHANGYSDELSIDRRDNDGNYTPENCWWTNAIAQARNTSRTVWVEHQGRRVSLTEAVGDLGISYQPLYDRIKHKGMTLDEAIADIGPSSPMAPFHIRMKAARDRKRIKAGI
jgi:hypothetical protein